MDVPMNNISKALDQPATKKIGMTVNEFRKKHDIDYIVDKVLKSVKTDMIYTKSDIIQLTGLRPGYPGLSNALENATENKGRAGGVNYWGNKDTIEELKKQAIMT